MSLYTVEQFLLGVWTDSTRLTPRAGPIELRQNDDPEHVIVMTQTVAAGVDIRLDPFVTGQEVTVSGLLVLTFNQAVTLWVGQVGSAGGDEGPGASSALAIPAPVTSGKSVAVLHTTFTRTSTRGIWLRTTVETTVEGFMVLT